MGRVPKTPRRRTYRTGGQLPALTTDFRPIPLGRDSQGEPDGQVRALAVLLRNRSDSEVYVREGPDADDEFEISPGEQYKIWEPNGVNSLSLRGEVGGERVEVRSLEAHNDFDITNKIDAFARSIAHFVGTATANTTITGQDVDLTIDDAGGINVAGTVDVGQFADTVTIDDITATSATFDVAGTVDVGQFADTITVDDITAGTVTIDDITGQTTNLTVDGTVDIDQIADSVDVGTITTISDTITIDDITAANASFDGDITGQTDFDFQVFDRQGYQDRRVAQQFGASISQASPFDTSSIWQSHTWTLFEPIGGANYAGEVKAVRYSIFDPNTDAEGDIKYYGPIVEIDRDNTGSWDAASSEWKSTPKHVADTGASGGGEVEMGVYSPNYRCDLIQRFPGGIRFEAGDNVRLNMTGRDAPDPSTDNYAADITVEVIMTLRPKVTGF